jgi:hypothetical protein
MDAARVPAMAVVVVVAATLGAVLPTVAPPVLVMAAAI